VRLAVVGDPVDHSLSPAIHNAALRTLGIEGSYVGHRVDATGMVDVVRDLLGGVLDGVNVTMPHKRLAARLVTRLAAEARRTDAVNALTRVGDEAVGHNTDVAGMVEAWGRAGLPVDRPVMVLGSGGAAAAALMALEMIGAGPIGVVARSASSAHDLIDRLGVDSSVQPFGGTGFDGAVIVNATPLGMRGELLPVPLEEVAGLFDMAYGTEPTPAVAAAVASAIPVADGVSMLLGQAAQSFRLWTGRPAPLDAMRAAVEVELARRRGEG